MCFLHQLKFGFVYQKRRVEHKLQLFGSSANATVAIAAKAIVVANNFLAIFITSPILLLLSKNTSYKYIYYHKNQAL